jgi:hypothetical protein
MFYSSFRENGFLDHGPSILQKSCEKRVSMVDRISGLDRALSDHALCHSWNFLARAMTRWLTQEAPISGLCAELKPVLDRVSRPRFSNQLQSLEI